MMWNWGHGMGAGMWLSVLRERYARGEIDGSTYEQMRRELSG